VRLLAWPKGTKAADLLAWDLSIGGLDPVTELDGIRSRLGNLGFDCGGETGDLGPKTEAALEAFRMREAIDEEDLLGPKTIERLETAFGA
jgi:peptidoglycan hydrolase-like protein with peptidoglycan-binding domain